MRLKLLGPEHEDTNVAKRNLGRILYQAGKLDEAEGLMRESLAATRKNSGENHPSVSVVKCYLGTLLRDRGDLAASEGLPEEALRREKASHTGPHLQVIRALTTLAATKERLGKLAEAEVLAREALTMIPRADLPADNDRAADASLVLASPLIDEAALDDRIVPHDAVHRSP